MKFLLLSLMMLLSFSNAFGKISPADQQYIESFNMLPNGGFENGTSNWTNVGGTFAITTTAGDIGEGNASGVFTASATSQYVETNLVSLSNISKDSNQCAAIFKYKGGDTNLTAYVYDSSSNLLTSTALSAQTKWTKFISETFVCPTQVKLRIGSTASAAAIYLDSGFITNNPLLYKNLLDAQYVRFDTYAGYGSSSTQIPRYTNNTSNIGTQILTVSNSSVTGLTFTATKTCEVKFSATYKADLYFGWSLNSTQLTTGIQNITATDVLAMEYQNNTPSSMGGSVILKAGDVLRPHTNGGAFTYGTIVVTATAESENIITPAKSGIEKIMLNGFTSRDAGTNLIKFKTQQWSTLSKIAVVSNSGNYTRITALKKVIAFPSCNVSNAGAVMLAELQHRNSAGTVLEVSNQYQENNQYANASLPMIMDIGDYLTISSSTALINDTVNTQFSSVFVDFEQQMLSAMPNIVKAGIPNTELFSLNYGTTNATTICSASPCSYLDQIGSYVSSITRNSTGNYTINLTKTFSKLKCTISPFTNATTPISIAPPQCSSCNTISFAMWNGAGASQDTYGTILCQGY